MNDEAGMVIITVIGGKNVRRVVVGRVACEREKDS
jgi:hypothetical protein